jgi:hypothetical protein
VQTSKGIEKLALLDRRTVLRKQWAPGSIVALAAVRDHRAEIGRPLVRSSKDPERYWSLRVKLALAFCRQFPAALKNAKIVRSAPEVGTGSPMRPRRALRNAHDVRDLPLESDEVRKLRLSGKLWKRTNPEKISIFQLGLRLKLTAPAVRKWLLEIPAEQKAAIEKAMLLPREAIPPEEGLDPRSILEATEPEEDANAKKPVTERTPPRWQGSSAV